MARLALGEALTNLVWARVSSLPDVKASVNWMYAAKLGQEGAAMYDAAIALRSVYPYNHGELALGPPAPSCCGIVVRAALPCLFSSL